ncbi:phosphoenolpyruvate--protein phosphotransferase [Balneola sp. MJW-20]|uniref:phosphoenolpyruvate--protein phosphotransferase n=1 Tax=Gracilimonas aurantiaca TaxID=3234185 RepID=UPI003466BCB8
MSGSNPANNKILHGLGCGSGKAAGNIVLIRHKKLVVPPSRIKESQVPKEIEKFSGARDELAAELDELLSRVHEKNSGDILDTLKQIIFDPDLEQRVHQQIEEKLFNAEYAVFQIYSDFIEKLRESGSELFRQRISDLRDLRDRMVDILSKNYNSTNIKEGQIIVASDLSPTDVVKFHDQGIAGIVLEKGGITSHATIIAQSLEIPCVVNLKDALKHASETNEAAIDGETGIVIFSPDKETLAEYGEQVNEGQDDHIIEIRKHETSDGKSFRLLANIEFRQELPRLKKLQYEGIGLLRTEGLLFEKVRITLEEQKEYYTAVFRETEGPVVVRLFDLGGDKLSLGSEKELNPFLGWRGIRMLLDEGSLLSDQLRALLMVASEYPGRLNVLIPMVSMTDEVERVKEMIGSIQKEIPDPDPEIRIGIMVEVPAVALKADHFATKVDFFSLGTNDLTQYTLAVDRGNQKINSLYQQYDPSVLKLIKLTAEAAKRNDIPVSVCGELAGSSIGAALIMGLGITDLSMSPRSMNKVRDLLCGLQMDQLIQFADEAVKMGSAEAVKSLFVKSFGN